MMLRILDHLEEWLIAFLIGAITLLNFTAVLHRYGLGIAMRWGWEGVYDWLFAIDLSWAQGLSLAMLLWMVLVGAAYGVRTGSHVGVDLLIDHLPQRVRSRFVLFGVMAGAVFTGVVGSLGTGSVWHLAHMHTSPPDQDVPVWLVYLAIPLGSWLMCFRFLEVAWSFFLTGERPRHAFTHMEGPV
jgi:C4-dicarboxylate transporter DctQ subunit